MERYVQTYKILNIKRFTKITELTNNFHKPDNACRGCISRMNSFKEFKQHLLEHIYLENEIIFPKTIDFEKLLVEKL